MKDNIKNEVSSTGAVICVVCNRPGTWHVAKDVTYTSPLRRVKVRNLDALVHECCLPKLYADMARQLRRALWISRVKQLGRASAGFVLNAALFCVFAPAYFAAKGWAKVRSWRRA